MSDQESLVAKMNALIAKTKFDPPKAIEGQHCSYVNADGERVFVSPEEMARRIEEGDL